MKTNPPKEQSSPHFAPYSKPFFHRSGPETFFSHTHETGQAFFSPSSIQPKLIIGRPDDAYEQEADAMADKVVQQMKTPGAPSAIQTKFEGHDQEEDLQRKEEEDVDLEISRKPAFESSSDLPDDHIQTKSKNGENISAPSLESGLTASKGEGAPLPEDTRNSMESAFGNNFGRVKIHTDPGAVQMNQAIRAKAFTHGSDIFFNTGQYSPQSSEGQKLLAHELTHVVQQGNAITPKRIQRKDEAAGAGAEKEAAGNQNIVGSVGALHADNVVRDVMVIQKMLAEVGLLSPQSIAKEHMPLYGSEMEEVVAESRLTDTIAAIHAFQKSLGWKTTDGNISPGTPEKPGQTITALKKAVGKAQEEKAKKEQEKKANEPATRDHVKELYDSVDGDSEAVGKLMAGYVIPNPDLVKAMIGYVGFFYRDNVALYTVTNCDKDVWPKADKTLIRLLYDAMDWGWTGGEEDKAMALLEPYLPKEDRKKEESPEDPDPNADPVTERTYIIADGNAVIRQADDLSKGTGETIPRGTKIKIAEIGTAGGTTYVKAVSPDKQTTYGWTSEVNIFDLKYATDVGEKMFDQAVYKDKKGNLRRRGYFAKIAIPFDTISDLRTKGGYRAKMDAAIEKGEDYDQWVEAYIAEVKRVIKEEGHFSEDQKALFDEAEKISLDASYRDKAFKAKGIENKAIDFAPGALKDGNMVLKQDLVDRLNRYYRFLLYKSLITDTTYSVGNNGGARGQDIAHRWSTAWMIQNAAPTQQTTLLANIKALTNGTDQDGNVWYVKSEDLVADDDDKTYANIVSRSQSFWTGDQAAEGYDQNDPRKKPNIYAYRSNHTYGEAVDITFRYKLNYFDPVIDAVSLLFGLSRPVKHEYWHYERAGAVPAEAAEGHSHEEGEG